MKPRTVTILVAVLAVLALTALACSSADVTPASQASQAPAAAPAVAPAVAPAAAPAVAAVAPRAPAAQQQPAAAAPAAPAAPAAQPLSPIQAVIAQPTAVPTPSALSAELASLSSIDLAMQGPGYQVDWGQPQTGGILRYGASHVLDGHDPNYGHSFEGPQFLPTYNALLRYDPWLGVKGAIEGDLAETWELTDGGNTVTFSLRKGVMFQDNPNLPAEIANISGGEFTCEDALASFDYSINPPEGILHTGPRAAFTHFKSSSCIDPYTFQVNFNEPLARTLANFAGGLGMPHNMPKEFITWLRQEEGVPLDETTSESFLYGTGTGAFVPIEFQADVITKVRANPTYFREGLPLLDGMDQFMIRDGTTRLAALMTGQIDYYGEGSASLLPGQVTQIQKSFADKIVIQPTLHSWGKGVQLNMERPPLDDVRVRQALHLGIDRDDWVEFNIAGTLNAVRRPTNWMPPGTIWALPDDELMALPGWRQGAGKAEDIVEANRLLDDALGVGTRFSLECLAQSSQIYIDGCLFVQDQFKKNLGIEVSVAAVEGAVQNERGLAGQYDMHYGSKVRTNVADPDDFYMIHLVPDTYSWYYEARGSMGGPDAELARELEQLVIAQSKELDVAKRVEMVHNIERKLATEAFFSIPFPWTFIFPAWRTSVRGWTLDAFPSQVKWTQWERTWLNTN